MDPVRACRAGAGAGEIAHSFDQWEQAGGGGGVAAVQLALLADEAHLFTALGDDDLGRRAKAELEARGVVVHDATDERPQRWGFTHLDENGERTITTVGPKMRPRGHDDRLPWHELGTMDAVFFVAGDADALINARRARVLTATSRELEVLKRAAVPLDALIGSGNDEAERYRAGELEPAPELVVTTSGSLGGWSRPAARSPRRRLPARSWTHTGPETASPPGSRSRSRRASSPRMRSPSRPAAARRRSPAAASRRVMSRSASRRRPACARAAREPRVGNRHADRGVAKWGKVA